MNTIHDRMHRNASPSMARLKRKALPLSLSLLGMVAGSLLPCGDASAAGPAAGTLPTGNSVFSGSASVSTTGTTLTVTQSSAQLAMNWATFDIASNATVNFAQPSANSIALNRIGIGSSSPAASQIFGNLTATGQLFLINPAGIVFGAGSTINVGGLVASTLDMDPTTLSGGAQSFHLDNNSGGGASVLNHGTINAAIGGGGGVALVGSSVSNDGKIVASAGHIFMDGADHATLDFDGNNLINVTITGGVSSASGTAAVSNSGTLLADGGTVVLRATATPGLFTQMVNNSGVVEAKGISNVNNGAGGSVQLIGSGGEISNSGTVSANGASGAAAGSVVVTGDNNQSVTLGGTVSTTGLAGGGVSVSGGSLALSGAVNADASSVTLNSSADITQSGTSVVTAGLLAGSSAGNTTLSNSNAIQSVGNFNSSAGFTLNNVAALQVGGLAANGAVALTTTGTGSNLTLNGNVSAQSLSLNSGGAISQTGGVLTAASLSGSSVGSTSLGQANLINSLAGFSAGGFSLVNASALSVDGAVNGSGGGVNLNTTSGSLTLNGTVSGANVSLTSAGALTLGTDVTASQALSLSGAAITQTGGALTANLLSGQSIGDTSLNGISNNVGTLGTFSAANFNLTNGGALLLNGPLNVSGNATVTTSTGNLSVQGAVSGSNVTLTGGNNVSLGGNVIASNNLTLNGASINQTAGMLSANTLTGSSAGITSLTQGNAISTLGSFSASGFSLTNAGTLSVTGPVISSNGLSLTTTSGSLQVAGTLSGSAVALSGNSGIGLANNVTAANSLSLVSANGAITQTTGTVTTSLLTGSSYGSAMLGSVNQVSTVGGFSANGFTLVNGRGLSVIGPLTSTGDLTLSATSGDLTLSDLVSGQRVSLSSANGAVSQIGGSLSANTLTGSSATGTSLSSASNLISNLGNYSSGGGFMLYTGGNLQLTGAVNSSNVSLNAVSGSITEAVGGSITAGTLGGGSLGATQLNQVNQIGSLDNYNSHGDFSLTNGQAITQSGTLQVQGRTTLRAGGQSITLTGNNNLVGPVSISGGTTQINNSRALTFDTSSILGDLTATTTNATIGQLGALNVTGTSTFNAGTGAIALTNANNALASSAGQTVNATGTGIAITNSGDLRVGTLADGANGALSLIAGGSLFLPSAAINTGTGDLTLMANGGTLAPVADLSGNNVTLAGGQGLNLAHNVTATQTLNLLSSTGAITQSAGVLNAGALTGASLGNTMLKQSGNRIAQLGNFTANNFGLVNAGALIVNGALTSTGTVALETQSGDLTLAGNLSGTGVALKSDAGAIAQQGGGITANTLSGASQGSTTLNQVGNQIGQLDSFTASGFGLVNGSALTVNGLLSSPGNLALTTVNGDLTLAGTVTSNGVVSLAAVHGAVSQTGGSLSAGTLSGQSGGATSLMQSGNTIGVLGSYSSGGDFSLTNAAALAQSGPLQVMGNTVLNTGTHAITLNNSGNDLRGTLSITGGDTQIVSSGPLMLGASQINGSLSLTSTDPAIGQSGALSVTGSSYFNAGNGSIALTDANNQFGGLVSAIGTGIAIIGAGNLDMALLSNGANGAVSLISTGGTLTLPGTAIATGSSDLLLSSGGGWLTTAAGLSGANVSLFGSQGINLGHDVTASNGLSLVSSNGGITQAAGVLSAGTLNGSAAGAASLMQANQLRSIGNFSANGFSLTNVNGLTVSGPLLSNGDLTLVTKNGDLGITGTVSGNHVTLNSAGGITEGGGGNIVATTLSGSAGGVTSLGTHDAPVANNIGTLGGFDSPAGFSLTNDRTLTLASVDGSSYSVNAGTSPLYLWVRNGDLLQIGTTPLYNGQGTFAASGRIGTKAAPIYEIGTLPYVVESVGIPPAYFYARDRQGNPLSEAGSLAVNVFSNAPDGRAQVGIHRTDAYIDAGTMASSYQGYGVVPSGVRLPHDQDVCDPQEGSCQRD